MGFPLRYLKWEDRLPSSHYNLQTAKKKKPQRSPKTWRLSKSPAMFLFRKKTPSNSTRHFQVSLIRYTHRKKTDLPSLVSSLSWFCFCFKFWWFNHHRIDVLRGFTWSNPCSLVDLILHLHRSALFLDHKIMILFVSLYFYSSDDVLFRLIMMEEACLCSNNGFDFWWLAKGENFKFKYRSRRLINMRHVLKRCSGFWSESQDGVPTRSWSYQF